MRFAQSGGDRIFARIDLPAWKRDLARMIGDNPADASLRERCAALLPEPVAPSTAGQEPIPGVCRRLLALGRAMHVKLARKGYPVAEMLVERPPIAHLWTAWRCR